MTRYSVLLVCVAYFLSGCSRPAPAELADPSGPDSKAGLCVALGRVPEEEALCNYANDGELLKLLESVFPIGVATQADVQQRLSSYLLSSTTQDSGRIIEKYAIEQTLLPSLPVQAMFAYDEDGVLRGIHIVDT